MEDDDREKIRSNLGRLVLRTQWNEKLETCLLTKGVFKPKMIQLVKVKIHFLSSQMSVAINLFLQQEQNQS